MKEKKIIPDYPFQKVKKQTEELNKEGIKFLEGEPSFNCRIHPTDGWHEVGCPDKEWTRDQLLDALKKAKRSNEWLIKQYG